MFSRFEVLKQMSTPGPWHVLKTAEGKYQVLAGKVVVATCDKLWDAEFIVGAADAHNSAIQTSSDNVLLHRQIDELEAKLEALDHDHSSS